MKKSLRIYYITHDNGWLTGVLMRTWACWFDAPPPSAYGADEADVELQIEAQLQELEVKGEAHNTERYLWDEDFHVRRVAVDIHPQTLIEKRAVIGKKQIPLRIHYAWSKMRGGGFRVMLPRYGWWVVLETLDLAPEVLRSAVSGALLGEHPRWVYDFREEGEEYVKAWAPDWLKRRHLSDAPMTPGDENPTLHAVAEEWVNKAARRKMPLIVGEEPSVEATIPVIKRDPPASILLVGPAGVGKTTWVQRLAKMLAAWRKEKPDFYVPKLWATSAQRIISGMVYLGMWQERCLNLIEELSFEGDYLFVDRLTDILARQPGGSSIADMLTPAVHSGAVSLIAECSDEELERCQQRAPGLVGAFHVVRLEETPSTAMPALLQLYQRRRAMKIHIHPQGLRRLVAHLDAFQRHQRFPGKGLRFLDWLAQTDEDSQKTRTLYPADASKAYARFSGLPVELISDDHPAGPDEIAARLQEGVIGQDDACADAARVLARFKAGLGDPDKPCGALFFVGPTGVGKTELARQLTRLMFGDAKRMIRLDMSEYMAPGSSQRLLAIGAGTTSLAEQVRQQPLSLILLDEIEKAHPEVFDVLLGILGEGRLTDALGRLVDFRMALIVMTSNLGATKAGAAVGFGATPQGGSMRHVRDHFRPEFVARLDSVSPFRHLDLDDITRIVDLEVKKAASRAGFSRRNLRLVVTRDARRHLAQIGYHPDYGARPLRRAIEERVMTPVAVLMAQSPDLKSCDLMVDLEDGELTIS